MNRLEPASPHSGAPLQALAERERVAAVRATGLLDGDDPPALVELPALAARACGMSIAALALIADQRQVLIGRVGIEARELPRDHGFCAQVVDRLALFEVGDALERPELRDNPLVRAPSGMRSYVGVPVCTDEGHCLGALFVADRVPRTPDANARELLAGLARVAARTIALHTDAERLRRIRRVQEAAAAALGRVVDAEALHVAFDGLLADLLRIADSAYGFVGEVRHTREGKPYLKTHAITNIAWNDETRALYEREAATGMEFHRLDTLFGHTMTSQAAVYANDPANDPRRGGLPPGHPPLDAFVGLPIHSRGKMVGMIGLANRPDGYTPGLAAELEPLLASIASIIEAARTERERRIATEELARQRAATREREQRFRAALESLEHVAVQSYGADGRIKFWNRASETLYGVPAQKALGSDVVELLFAPHERDEERATMASIAASGDVPAAGEVTLTRTDGGQVTVYAARVLVPYTDGPPEIFCFDVDVTARKAAEDAQRASEERLREIADSIPGAIFRYIIHPDGSDSLAYMSRGSADIWEIDAASLMDDPTPLWAMVLPEDLPAMRDSVGDSARTLTHWRHQWRIRTPSGKLKSVVGSGAPVRTADGDIVWNSFLFDRSPQAAAETALAQSEARYRAIAENIPGAIFRYLLHPDNRHSVEFISRGAQAIWERQPAAIETDAQLLFRAIAPEDRDGFRDSLLESARTLGLWQHRWRIVTPSGGQKWLQGSAQPVRREDGNVAWDGYVFDVTERREAEAALALSEARLRVLMESAPEAIVVFDVEAGQFVDFNSKACVLFGVDAERLRSLDPATVSPPLQPDGRPSASATVAYLQRAVAGEEPVFEWLHQRADGTPVPCEIHLVRIPDPRRVLVRGSLVDITARKAAERALAQTEARLGLIVQNMLDGFFVLDQDWRVLEVNAAAARSMDARADELVGQDLRKVFPGVEVRTFGLAYASVLSGGPSLTVSDFHPLLKRWYEARVQPAGSGIAVFFSDITERKQAESALRDSERRFRSLVEDIGTIAVQGYDSERRIVFWNSGSEKLYGWPAAEVMGRRLEDTIIPIPMRAAVVDIHTHWLAEGRIDNPSEELVLVDRHGLPVPVYSSHIMQEQPNGELVLYCLDVDLRDLRRSEEALQQANAALRQRNAELQQFVMIASHDLQEPLRKVQTFADRLQGSLGERLRADEADYVARLIGAAARMRALIQDLLDYSAVSFANPQRARVDLDEVLDEVLDDLEQAIAASGAVVRRAPLGVIDADPVQMRQLLQNLVGNALKYRDPARSPEIAIDGAAEMDGDDRLLRITIADNGIGFDAAYRERIFTPFQRLHARTEYSGTGIGLAIVRRIVDQHGGRIEAHGNPGVGASFIVHLPCSA